ncbi:MAG: DUF3810 domain-containing protein [Chitinophagaceae bacterium]
MTKRGIAWWVLIVLALGIKLFSLFPNAVEYYYSNGFYPLTARVQRMMFGWAPFSIGDILYALVVIYLIYKIIELIKKIRKKQLSKVYWRSGAKRLIFIFLFVYVWFNLFWGLNYNRLGIAHQLGLTKQKINKEDIISVMEQLLIRVNQFDTAGKINRSSFNNKKNLFNKAVDSYKNLSKQQDNFSYNTTSVKPSLFIYVGNYLGYSGYYNPFTGEAQVNTTVPLFVQPFTTCHEIGHQLGYAKENEANFAGYLSAKNSTDSAFLYSVYFELYTYGRRYLYGQDSLLLRKLDSQLLPGVKKDFKELKDFFIKYENPAEKIIDKLYGQFLKANEQPSGKVSYSEVIIWLIAYYKKFGKEAL